MVIQYTIKHGEVMKYNKIKKTAIALAILASVGAPVSYAEEVNEEIKEVEVISVTGSRIARTDIEGISQVVVFDKAALEASAMTNVGQFLQKMPSITGPSRNSAQQYSNGTSTVTLRGLGARNTLVLINGRRLGSSGVGGASDLNSVPMAAIKSIEVLQDGASAIYGSDAIAGVVNIIMNDGYDGLQVKTSYGISAENDNAERGIEITYGMNTDKGNLLFNYSRHKTDGYVMAARDVQSDPDRRGLGGPNNRDPFSSTGTTYNIDDDWWVLKDDATRFNTMDDLREYKHPWDESFAIEGGTAPGDPDGFNYWLYDMGAGDVDVENIWASGAREVSDDAEVYFEYLSNKRKSYSESQPYGFTADFGDPVTYSADNKYNNTGQSFSVARALVELGGRSTGNIDSTTTRFVVGIRGEFHEFDWDFSLNRQRTKSYDDMMGVSFSRVLAATGSSADCEARNDGCVPLDLMGKVGSITPDMLNYLQVDAKASSESTMDSYQFNVNGSVYELPAGDIGIAFGAEYRTEHAIQDYASIDNQGDRIFQSALGDTNPPEREVTEFYGEIVVPLLADMPMAKLLELDMAARYSDYSDFGTTTTPKFGLRWQPMEGVLVRSSYSEGFRAPGFDELYSGLTGGWSTLPADPCAEANYASLAGCPQNFGGPALAAPNGFSYSGGNADLKPEESESVTAGIVWVPSFMEGFTISLDMFDIEKSNVIRRSSANTTVQNNAKGISGYESMVERDPTDGHITGLYVLTENTGFQNIKGYDTEVTYLLSTDSFGEFNFNYKATVMTDYDTGATKASAVDLSGNWYEGSGSYPELKSILSSTWTYDDIMVNWSVRYVDGVEAADGEGYWGGSQYKGTKKIDSYVQHDAQFSYHFDQYETKVSMGIENVLDEEPPLVLGSYRNGFDANAFSSRGRYFYARLSMSF